LTEEGQALQASGPRERRPDLARYAGLIGLLGAVVLVALLMFAGGNGYRVSATFENGGQLVPGNEVRVGGRAVGTIESVELDQQARAVVEMDVTEAELAPLHRGTRATIRSSSLAGIADRYVSLEPGRNDGPELPDGGEIASVDASAPVDIDQLFNTLDPATREGLRGLVRGQGAQYERRGPDGARSLRYLSPALSSTSRLTRELVADDEVFERFLRDTSRAMGTIASRRDELSSAVADANTTVGAIGDENASLARGLDLLPGTLRKASSTFVNLRAALDDLDVLVAESKPATRDLAPFLRRLRPLIADSRPTIRELRTLIRTPGADNDLIELAGRLPRLAQLTSRSFPRAIRTFDRSQELVDTLRHYTPDLTGFLTKFGQAASAYDANGHYARVQPIFAPFRSNPTTGELTRLADTQRLDFFQLGRKSRCPGSAIQAPPDGSAPFAVEGCDPDAVPPGG